MKRLVVMLVVFMFVFVMAGAAMAHTRSGTYSFINGDCVVDYSSSDNVAGVFVGYTDEVSNCGSVQIKAHIDPVGAADWYIASDTDVSYASLYKSAAETDYADHNAQSPVTWWGFRRYH
jgi:hypothetical protein